MVRVVYFLLLVASIFTSSQASSIVSLPQPLPSFKLLLDPTKNENCSYSVIVTTSCSSPKYMTDHISLSFGDADDNQVFVPMLEDPLSGTFDQCSVDPFLVSGPCTSQICYLYLYRTGNGGWKPESVEVSGNNSIPVTFNFDEFIPSGVWYGFNYCSVPEPPSIPKPPPPSLPKPPPPSLPKPPPPSVPEPPEPSSASKSTMKWALVFVVAMLFG